MASDDTRRVQGDWMRVDLEESGAYSLTLGEDVRFRRLADGEVEITGPIASGAAPRPIAKQTVTIPEPAVPYLAAFAGSAASDAFRVALNILARAVRHGVTSAEEPALAWALTVAETANATANAITLDHVHQLAELTGQSFTQEGRGEEGGADAKA